MSDHAWGYCTLPVGHDGPCKAAAPPRGAAPDTLEAVLLTAFRAVIDTEHEYTGQHRPNLLWLSERLTALAQATARKVYTAVYRDSVGEAHATAADLATLRRTALGAAAPPDAVFSALTTVAGHIATARRAIQDADARLLSAAQALATVNRTDLLRAAAPSRPEGERAAAFRECLDKWRDGTLDSMEFDDWLEDRAAASAPERERTLLDRARELCVDASRARHDAAARHLASAVDELEIAMGRPRTAASAPEREPQ